MYTTINYSSNSQGVLTLTIDIPGNSANVMNESFRDELGDAIERAVNDASIKGIILTSAKRDFMAGGDLKSLVNIFDQRLSEAEAFEIAEQLKPLLRRMETCGKPVVAAINGSAMGGGLELALACHHRIVADARGLMIGLPEVSLGLMPGGGGSQRLPRMIGVRKALPIMLKGAPLSPSEALEAGVVDQVVGPEALLDAAVRWILEEGKAIQPWDEKGFQIPGGAGFMGPEPGQTYNLLATNIALETQRNYPAPIALLHAVARGTCVPIDAGLHIESCQFAKLLMDPVARNMIRTLFVNKGELEKLARRPEKVEAAQFKSVGVIGAGLMGAGVAQSAAQAGISVLLLDSNLEKAEAGKQRLAAAFAKRVERGRMDRAKADCILERITPVDDYSALAACELVVEAVFENRNVKQEVFRHLEAVLAADAIIASNTSSLPITSLAEGIDHPSRFIGLHFFSPVDRMPLVEVINGQQTSEACLAHALDSIKKLRKTPILVNDARGFFTTRVISAYLQESMSMLSEGYSPTLIDNVARQAGFPVGPLAMTDELTIEIGYHAVNQEREDLADAWVEPPGYQVQQTFVETLNRKGRRHGAGFYDYVDGERYPWDGIREVYLPFKGDVDIDGLKLRLLYIQSLVAARCMEEGVIEDPAEGDVGSVLGIGFPTYTGGVFSLIDTVGIEAFVETCDRFADKFGERWAPSEWLRRRALKGELFYPAQAAS